MTEIPNRACIIRDGRVANVALVNSLDDLRLEDGETAVLSEEAGVDWLMEADGLFPPPSPPKSLEERRTIARAECARRIIASANANTQANMTAYVTVLNGKASLTATDKADLAAFAEAISWVAQMRTRWPDVAAQGLDPADDANWPEPSRAALSFAARF